MLHTLLIPVRQDDILLRAAVLLPELSIRQYIIIKTDLSFGYRADILHLCRYIWTHRGDVLLIYSLLPFLRKLVRLLCRLGTGGVK